MFKPSHQIRFLISPIENLLICLKYLLVPFGFLTIAFRVYKAPEILEQKIGLTMGAWQLGLLLIATLLLYLPKTFTTMNHSFLWFRRHLILLCESGFPVVLSRSSKTFCAISRYRYPYPSLTHKGQKEIERIIINYLKKGVSRTTCGPIFYISGKSGAGKSTLAFFICHSIVVEKIYNYMDSIFFYDFGKSIASQSDFINDSNRLRHEQKVLIIDNFQDILPEHLGTVTKYLIDLSSRSFGGCIILLSQPIEMLSVNPGGDIQLISKVKKDNSYFELNQIDPRNVTAPPDEKVNSVFSKQKILDPNSDNYALVCLNISRLIQRVSFSGNKQSDEFNLSYRSSFLFNRQIFLSLLGLICALSIHRGGFTKDEFRRACFLLAKKKHWISQCLKYFSFKILLARLTHDGFVETRSLQGKKYVFHDALAQHYKDLFYNTPIFSHVFQKTLLNQIEILRRTESNYFLCWLYGVEIGSNDWCKRLFDNALLKSNFKRMLITLQRNQAICSRTTFWSWQMGILTEKVGLFSESRRYLHQIIKNENTGKEYHRSIISLIEAEHGQDSIDKLREISKRSDRVTHVAAEYWILHINSHSGDFNLKRLFELTDLLLEIVTVKEKIGSYFVVHLCRRVYFDLFRFYYLEGSDDYPKLLTIKNHKIGTFLRLHHVEYDAFYLKFYSAHYIHYSLIYELGLFKRKPVNYDKNLIPKSFFKNVKITTFSDLAIDYYKRAINSFEIFGDKTIEYIHPRIIEMELLKPNPNMEDLRIKLNQFSKFIMDSKFKDLRSYPHIYLFKLNYIYSILILLRTGGPDSELLRIEDSDFYKKKAIAELDNAIKIELIENNQYGIVRGLFFKALTQFVAKKNKKQFSTEMDRLYEESKNRGFLREQKLFNKLRQENGLSLQDVLDIIKFYPVVLQ